VNVSYLIPYSFLRQDAVVAWITFYGIAGLKSLANYQLRSYHTHKVWYGGVDDVRATGHKTPGESSVILQSAIMIQLTSRRILRD